MKNIKILISVFVFLVITSCSVDNAKNEATGNMVIKISDAPMPYDQFMEANVTIDKIEIRNKINHSMTNVLANDHMTVNLLELVNGITETLSNANLPIGDYDLLRLYISSTQMVMKNGEIFSNNMNYDNSIGNGMMQDGMMFNNNNHSIDIQIQPYLHVTKGLMEDFLIDIDVNHSFMLEDVNYVDNGTEMMMQMSGYSFNPMLRFVKLSTCGTIEGVVHDEDENLPNATVSLMKQGEVYTSTHTDANGHYTLIGVPKDTYTINVEANHFMMATTGNEENMNAFNMMEGSTLNMDFVMTTTN